MRHLPEALFALDTVIGELQNLNPDSLDTEALVTIADCLTESSAIYKCLRRKPKSRYAVPKPTNPEVVISFALGHAYLCQSTLLSYSDSAYKSELYEFYSSCRETLKYAIVDLQNIVNS